MLNDSTTTGYLVPTSAAPAEDLDLDGIFQALIVGSTGLPGNMVRPRWQPVTPQQPDVTVNWCAIGVMSATPDDNPAIVHNGSDAGGYGSDTLYRHELIEVLASFYGPQGQQFATIARDGFRMPQNSGTLGAANMVFTGDCGPIRPVPELVNQQWRRRYDLPAWFRRQIIRTYGVRNLLTARIDLCTQDGLRASVVLNGSISFTEVFTRTSVVTIPHGLCTFNLVAFVYDSGGALRVSALTLIDANTVALTFAAPASGAVRVVSSLNNFSQSFTSATTVTVQHNLGTLSPLMAVYDAGNGLIDFDSLTVVDSNNVTVRFASAASGRVVIVAPVAAGYSQAFTSATTVTVTHNLATLTPAIAVFNAANSVAGFSSLTISDPNSFSITFAVPQSGRVVVF